VPASIRAYNRWPKFVYRILQGLGASPGVAVESYPIGPLQAVDDLGAATGYGSAHRGNDDTYYRGGSWGRWLPRKQPQVLVSLEPPM
jgi:hypothetical protein